MGYYFAGRKCLITENKMWKTSELKMNVPMEHTYTCKKKWNKKIVLGRFIEISLAVTCVTYHKDLNYFYTFWDKLKKARSGTYVPSTKDWLGGNTTMVESSIISYQKRAWGEELVCSLADVALVLTSKFETLSLGILSVKCTKMTLLSDSQACDELDSGLCCITIFLLVY